MIAGKKEKFFNCSECGLEFSNLAVDRTCSNCFACTGCEIYLCPKCGTEVVIKPIKPMNKPGRPL